MPQGLSRISLTRQCIEYTRLRWGFGELFFSGEKTKRSLPKRSAGSDPATTLIKEFLEPDINGKTSTGWKKCEDFTCNAFPLFWFSVEPIKL